MTRSGLIYDEFDEKKHVVSMPSGESIRNMRLGVGIDTGKHFAAVLCGFGRDNQITILGETYTGTKDSGENIYDNCEAIREMLFDVLGVPFGLKERDEDGMARLIDAVDLWYVDPASQHKMDLENILDIPLSFEKAHIGELLSTIDQVRNLFRNDNLLITEECQWLLWEMERYIWMPVRGRGNQTKSELMPRKRDDHALDAARFILVQMIQAGPLEVEHEAITFDEAWESQVRYEVFGHLREDMRRSGASVYDRHHRIFG